MEEVYSLPLGELMERRPACADFLRSYGLEGLDRALPLMEAIERAQPENLKEQGLQALDMAELLEELLRQDTAEKAELEQIELLGGTDKDGQPEDLRLVIRPGEVVSLVGPTGSGKSQLLADIECAARGDTPTGRRVLFDGKELADEQRYSLSSRLVAQLAQNMNFVIDISVEDFLRMHAGSRQLQQPEELIRRCFETANALSGEPFALTTRVTRLSGGQARALMIADAACISPSPILLIDEIENAGIDRLQAVELLRGGDKIVLLATHDPLLALSASRRIVLRNGGVKAVLETDEKEKEVLSRLIEADRKNADLQRLLRAGERIGSYVGTV